MADTITRDDLAEELRDRLEISMTDARDEVKWFFERLAKAALAGNEVRIHGFGTFRTAEKKAGMRRNPRTGEAVHVPARRVLRFKPSTTLAATLRAKGVRKASTKTTKVTKAKAKKTGKK